MPGDIRSGALKACGLLRGQSNRWRTSKRDGEGSQRKAKHHKCVCVCLFVCLCVKEVKEKKV